MELCVPIRGKLVQFCRMKLNKVVCLRVRSVKYSDCVLRAPWLCLNVADALRV